MAEVDPRQQVIQSGLGGRQFFDALMSYFQEKMDTERERRASGDFFTQAAALMRQQSRVDTISEIMAELTAIREMRESE